MVLDLHKGKSVLPKVQRLEGKLENKPVEFGRDLILRCGRLV